MATKRSEVLSLRITPAEMARIKAISEAEERSIAQVVRRALREYSEKTEGKSDAA